MSKIIDIFNAASTMIDIYFLTHQCQHSLGRLQLEREKAWGHHPDPESGY